jgi:hypothetical protein
MELHVAYSQGREAQRELRWHLVQEFSGIERLCSIFIVFG